MTRPTANLQSPGWCGHCKSKCALAGHPLTHLRLPLSPLRRTSAKNPYRPKDLFRRGGEGNRLVYYIFLFKPCIILISNELSDMLNIEDLLGPTFNHYAMLCSCISPPLWMRVTARGKCTATEDRVSVGGWVYQSLILLHVAQPIAYRAAPRGSHGKLALVIN